MTHPPSFFAKLEKAIRSNNSLLCVGLDPIPEQLPLRYRHPQGDVMAGILAWNRAVIETTADLVCAYKPNIAFYEALGLAGQTLLRQTLALIPAHIPVILDAKRGDMGSTAAAYARACFAELGVDAVTLSPYLGRDSIEPFAQYADRGLFVLCHTSNPSAGEFQALEISDWRTLDRSPNQPLYLHVAGAAVSWSTNIGLVVGATYPAAMAAVRAAAPAAWFLVPGVGAQGGDLAATLRAGLRADGSGVIINVSRSVCLAEDHRAAALALRTEIESIRREHLASVSRIDEPNKDKPNKDEPDKDEPDKMPPQHQSLVVGLARLAAIKFGDFTLASGAQSPFYIDLRLLVSQPALLAGAASAYVTLLAGLPCDLIAGVPYAALPIATAMALESGMPLVYLRKEVKAHGLGKAIEGVWQPGERVVIIEDLITSGGSVLQTAHQLRAAGLIVEHAIVLIDRQQGGVENLAAAGITVHSVFKLSEMLEMLVQAGELEAAKQQAVLRFIRKP